MFDLTDKEQRRKRQRRKWDACNLRTVCTRMPMKEYWEFQKLCFANGETVYSCLKKIIRGLIAASKIQGKREKGEENES